MAGFAHIRGRMPGGDATPKRTFSDHAAPSFHKKPTKTGTQSMRKSLTKDLGRDMLGEVVSLIRNLRREYAMRYLFRRAFTLIELLVVVSIIGILMALLVPAVMSSRSSTRAVQCGANLHQIGIAFQHYKEKRGKTPDVDTILNGLDEYTESQNLMYVCPELGESVDTSYGVNMCVHRLLGESAKIIMMDAHVDTLEYEGIDQVTWNEDVAPRHHEMMNVLFYDGSVQRKTPLDFDPYDAARGPDNLEQLWQPYMGGCSGPCGIQGMYYALTEWGDNPVMRVDPTIHLPFGNAPFFGVPYSIPLEGSKKDNPWPLRTGAWYGQIKSEHSES